LKSKLLVIVIAN